MRQTRALLWLLLCCAMAFPAAASSEQLYVAGFGSHSVSGFSIGAEGALAPIACSEGSCELGLEAKPVTVAIGPGGKYLFVVSRDSGKTGSVSSFSIGAGGALSKVDCPKNCKTAEEPDGLASTPNGQFIYVANGASTAGKGLITTYSVGPGGALARVGCNECETEGRPFGLAVSPNGEFLYATDASSERVLAFSIGAGGAPSPVACPEASCKTGAEPTGITIAPNGQFLYVANRGSETVSAFQIGAGGALTPIACAEDACKTGSKSEGAAVTPDGEFLYVSNAGTGSISAFQIASDGSLSPLGCAAPGCGTGAGPVGIAASPDGRFLYTANAGASTISPFSIEPQGTLSGLTCAAASCETESAPFFQSLAITPDQAPTASFTDTPATAGSPSTFNASASTASPEQSVASYDWNFGDGTSAQSASPTVSHTYATAGPYTVTLTVTDTSGCSTQPIFTGQTASCNGSSSAEHAATVTVPAVPAVSIPSLKIPSIKVKLPLGTSFGRTSVSSVPLKLTLSNLSETARTWRESTALAHVSARTKGLPIGTRFSFELSEAATVTLTFARSLGGRAVGKKCVAPSKHNQHARHCTRTVVAGTYKLAAGRGLTTVRFYGRLSKYKKLSPGVYTLAASATAASGQHATTAALHLTIVKPAG
jgi:DNA-binding beta-propeller fold protein YncE